MNPKQRLQLGHLLMQSSLLDMENHNLIIEGNREEGITRKHYSVTPADHSFNRLPKNKPKKPKANRGRK
jgi:hypothetical protein